MYYGDEEARRVHDNWIAEVSNKKLADDIISIPLPGESENIIDSIVSTGVVESKAQARRLVAQGAIRLNEKRIEDANAPIEVNVGDIFHIGKKHTFRFGPVRGNDR